MSAPRAVLLDALGTLVELVEPWAALDAQLAARGAPVGREAARAALLAEMAHYRAHHDEAADAAGLEALRDRCAAVLRDALPAPARDLPLAELRAALLAALRFRAFGDAPPALAALRAGGARLVVVSNWDVSLHGVLRETGLGDLVDAVVTSAEAGSAKPDPAIFAHALAQAGVRAADAIHCGDDPATDVAGAMAAGIAPVLLARGGAAAAPAGVPVVRSLADLPGAGR